jgi:hypothetical protein
MKDDPIGPIQIVSIIGVIWIILTRIAVIFFIGLLKGEAIPYFNILIGSMAIDLFQILIVYCWVNIISAVLIVAIIHFPFKPGRFKKYFWLIFGLLLFIQPIFLTIIGVLLLIYSKNLSIEKKEMIKQSEGL